MKNIKENWYWCMTGLFLAAVALVYLIIGENSYIAVHDNLDLFTAQYKMLKDNGAFFAHGVTMPYLGGITRDYLPSEFALSSLLYLCLPMFAAYVVNYLLKIVIAEVSFYLLAKELFGAESDSWKPLSVLCGFAYGLLNVFPAFGIPFASVPLVLFILLKIDRAATIKKAGPWYVSLFVYPFVSYFTYFGLFLCGYLVIAFLWVSIRRKKVDTGLLLSVLVLSLGYAVFEYRLFASMLFANEPTIRTTMAGAELTMPQVFLETWDVLVHSMFHAESLHCKWVMPLCLFYFAVRNIRWLLKGEGRKVFHDLFNLMMFLLLCNAWIYALYDYAPMRALVETLCPPLQGWQFNRTLFFNPFLWYAALFVMLYQIVDSIRRRETGWLSSDRGRRIVHAAADGVVCIAILIILCSDTRYNDLLHTCYNTALETIKHKEPDCMNYREFYGEALFEKALADLHYDGEWSVAYGFHPAVLQYNGIATLDGYLGFYPQAYKEAFRKVIAPALDRVEGSRVYYDDWGARAYVYAGTDSTAVSEYKSFTPSDYDLYMDTEAFHELGGTYIFSRFPLTGTEALGLTPAGEYEDASVPYKLYVYQ